MKKIYSSPKFVVVELESTLLQPVISSGGQGQSNDDDEGEGGDVKEFLWEFNNLSW